MSVIADIENLNDGEVVERRSAADARNVLGQRAAPVPASAPQDEGEP
jgi:hypothetical protein